MVATALCEAALCPCPLSPVIPATVDNPNKPARGALGSGGAGPPTVAALACGSPKGSAALRLGSRRADICLCRKNRGNLSVCSTASLEGLLGGRYVCAPLCACVSVCTRVTVSLCTSAHACLCVRHVHTPVSLCGSLCMRVCVHTCDCGCLCVSVGACTRASPCISVCARVRVCAHVAMCVWRHLRVCTCVSTCRGAGRVERGPCLSRSAAADPTRPWRSVCRSCCIPSLCEGCCPPTPA